MVASYRPDRPTLPSGWNDFAFWQSSERGTVDGVPGHDADISYFHSADPAALAAMTLKPVDFLQAKKVGRR